MKYCEMCKQEYDDSTVFCTQCGGKLVEKPAEELKQVMRVHKCPACDLEYPDAVRFCSQCGSELVYVEEEVPAGLQTVPVVAAPANVVAKPVKEAGSAENGVVTEEATEWEFSSRFLFRFAKEAKVTANESMLTIQKSFGFIFYVVLNMSKSAPVTLDIRDIKSVIVKESYSVWAGVFFLFALACLGKDKFAAAIIFAIIGYVELKYTKFIISYSGGTIEFGDSNSRTAEGIQSFLAYIRKFNPNCIQQ